jgi:hypothetical protein
MADALVAEKFELRRSSRAKVSERIATIDNDWTIAREHFRGIGQHFPERQMNRAGQMNRVVLVRRERVDNLCARRNQAEYVAMINGLHDQSAPAPRDRMAARFPRTRDTIVSPLPSATRAVSTS